MKTLQKAFTFNALALQKIGAVTLSSMMAIATTTALIQVPARAASQADIMQLTETGECQSCDLRGANLTGAHLIGVDLRDADLTGAVLSHANLEGADLTGATLINTNLSGAFLTNALLDDTIVSNVDLSNATLIYTSLAGADIEQVNLVGADVLNTPISVGGSYDQ